MRIWAAIFLISMSLIGAPLSMLGADHHNAHKMIASIDTDKDAGAMHSDHAGQQAEIAGMCCTSGAFSCAAVAVLALDDTLMWPVHFGVRHMPDTHNMMVDNFSATLERPPRLS